MNEIPLDRESLAKYGFDELVEEYNRLSTKLAWPWRRRSVTAHLRERQDKVRQELTRRSAL